MSFMENFVMREEKKRKGGKPAPKQPKKEAKKVSNPKADLSEEEKKSATALWSFKKDGIIKQQFVKSVKKINEDMVVDTDSIDVEQLKKKDQLFSGLETLDDALEYYSNLVEKDPKDWKNIYNKGIVLFEMEDYEASCIEMTKVLEVEKKCVQAYFQRGISFNMLENYPMAIEDFDEAIKLDPKVWKVYFHKGLVYQALKDNEAAVKCYSKSLALHKEDVMVYLNRGNLYRKMNKFEKAKEDFTKVVDMKVAESQLGLFNRAMVYFDTQKEPKKGIADFTSVLKTTNNLYLKAKSYKKRAFLYKMMGQYEKALDDLKKCIEFEPNKAVKFNPQIMIVQGLYIEKLKKMLAKKK